MIFKAVLLLVIVVGYIHGFPTGAPTSACSSMTPSHGVDAQPNTGNFAIKTSKTERNTIAGKLKPGM